MVLPLVHIIRLFKFLLTPYLIRLFVKRINICDRQEHWSQIYHYIFVAINHLTIVILNNYNICVIIKFIIKNKKNMIT